MKERFEELKKIVEEIGTSIEAYESNEKLPREEYKLIRSKTQEMKKVIQSLRVSVLEDFKSRIKSAQK